MSFPVSSAPCHLTPYPAEPHMAFVNTPLVLLAGPDVIEHDGDINLQSAKQLAAVVDGLNKRHQASGGPGNAIEYYFKSSYDKANRTSVNAYRGPGMVEGLTILQRIKDEAGVKIITDVHSPEEATAVAQVADMIQVPAFLSRQTDLLLAAGDTGKTVNIKKGQFLSPHDIIHAAEKVKSTGNSDIYITERGSTFGYNNLVVDMRGVPIVQSYGYPMIFDATHSIQLPGGQGTSSGGQREYALTLARAAVAAGCNGLFFETHPSPDDALCDGPNMLPIHWMEPLLETLLAIRTASQRVHQLAQSAQPALA